MTTLMTGSFALPGTRQFMAYEADTGNWAMGAVTRQALGWTYAGNSSDFGDISEGLTLHGDFTGSGVQSVLYYSPGDQNWWLGQYAGEGALLWSMIGNTTGFGQVGDGRPIWIGDFSGNGRDQVLFYYPGDGNWWLASLVDMSLTWTLAGNTTGFGRLDDGRPIWIGDFSGNGSAQVLFYYSGDGNWWLGSFTGTSLAWDLAGNTTGFGRLDDGRPIWTGDFSGGGGDQVLFYYPGDSNWWLGTFTGTSLAWDLAGNTAKFGNMANGQPIWTGDFDGNGSAQILYYSPGDQNWWLGTVAGTSLSWALAGNTSGFGQVGDGRPIWTGDFVGNGGDQVLFFYPGDGNWWLGSFDAGTLDWRLIGNGMVQPMPPTVSASRMLMVDTDGFSAPYIAAYDLNDADFTLSLMLQPDQPGSVLSGRNFTLSLGAGGDFTLVRITGGSQRLTASCATTSILGDGQCHILTIAVPAGGNPSLYLDGVLLVATVTTANGAPSTEQPLAIGGTGAFKGGIMNVGLWNQLIPADQYQFAGQGLIGALGDGLIGFWPMNGTLDDLSANANDFAPQDGEAAYMACLNCLAATGPHGATAVEIGNPGIAGDTSTQKYAQSVYVAAGASVLSAFVCDLVGGADFPAGLVLTITSPSGQVYGGTKVNDATVAAVPDADGTSLHALMVMSPEQGFWTIAITVPANVGFHFVMQVFPEADHWQSAMAQTLGSATHQRRMMSAQGWGSWFEAVGGIALAVVGAAIALRTGNEGALVIVAIGMALALHGIDGINDGDSLGEASAKVTVTPPSPPAANAWMKTLADTMPLGSINMPGSHDAAAFGIGSPWTCHNHDIATQLAEGIRVLDIRLKVYEKNNGVVFWTCHGDLGLYLKLHVYQPFKEVLDVCKTFLTSNPSECVVMSIKVDDDSHLPLGRYLSGLSTFLAGELGDRLYDVTATAMPTLSQVRGKVYCLNRVDPTGNSVGVPVGIDDNTADQTLPAMAGHRDYTVRVQDRYDYMNSVLGVEADKAAKVINLFGSAPSAGLALNFMSAVQAQLLGVYIQNRIINHIGENKPAFLGWVMMDYPSRKFDTTAYGALSMIDLVIASNMTPPYAAYPDTFGVTPFVATGQ